jgi:fibronectin type 3 domain-containing protein
MLDWTPVRGAHAYRVFRAVAGVWSPEPIATVFYSRFINFTLTNGTAYSYKVVAFNRTGSGPPSNAVEATPLAAPTELTAIGGDRVITLSWRASPGAMSYAVFRRTKNSYFSRVGGPVAATTLVDAGLTNGTPYIYRVRALTGNGGSDFSNPAFATPKTAPSPPPAAAPQNVSATPGNGQIQLSWNAVTGATDYRVFRTTNGTFSTTPIATVTTPGYLNTGLVNGTTYSYRVAAHNAGGDGPFSAVVSGVPGAAPGVPTNVNASAGNAMVTLSWTAVGNATSYNVYRSTTTNGQANPPLATGVNNPAFVDSPVTNGTTYFYKISAVNAFGEGARSTEVSARPVAPTVPPPPPPPGDPALSSTFRFLRQSTWGPRPGEIERVRALGTDAFLLEQMGAPRSVYPAALFDQPVETAQEQFMAFAMNGQDQLRQRMAWALHKIWVVSAVEVNNSSAILTYHGLLSNGAFGNYRDLMRNITLNPAMGRYLNMLNNRAESVTGVPANENYARELMQLFTLGTARLSANGTPLVDGAGAPIPTYTEGDVKALARLLTGWTFGDGDPNTIPTGGRPENWRVPMEAVARFHDVTAKTFLGRDFAPNQTAQQDLDQALDVLFEHTNLAPFISRQLIQQFVTSNPSPGYVADVAAAFNGGARGDLSAVIRAILTHPEATAISATGKLTEPVLFTVSMMRALNATVTDHPFMSNRVAEMGQNVFFPPSVFSYFSPGYRVRGTGTPPLGGPEFQILTSVTSMERVNFVGSLLGNRFGADVTVDYTPFMNLAGTAATLVDYCNQLFMGGSMSAEERTEIINAVNVTAATNPTERVRTALYLTLSAAQSQIDR